MLWRRPERMWFKGRAALAVDEWYSTGDVANNLREARDLLQRDTAFEEVVAGLSRGHDEFMYPLGGGALQGPAFETVARQGYLEAIGLALDHDPPVPIKTYWMTGAGNRKFEMHITDEAEHVSVTMLVPKVRGGSSSSGSPESWVVSMDRAGRATTKRTSGPDGSPQPSMRHR